MILPTGTSNLRALLASRARAHERRTHVHTPRSRPLGSLFGLSLSETPLLHVCAAGGCSSGRLAHARVSKSGGCRRPFGPLPTSACFRQRAGGGGGHEAPTKPYPAAVAATSRSLVLPAPSFRPLALARPMGLQSYPAAGLEQPTPAGSCTRLRVLPERVSGREKAGLGSAGCSLVEECRRAESGRTSKGG